MDGHNITCARISEPSFMEMKACLNGIYVELCALKTTKQIGYQLEKKL